MSDGVGMGARCQSYKAPAKLNLYLGVYDELDYRRYHRADSLMVALDLADELEFSASPDEKIHITSTPQIPVTLEDNSVYKAIRAMEAQFDRKAALSVHITKRIPARSGLGGPSSDAAAAIRALCDLWELDLDDPRISAAARSVGADVAFFLTCDDQGHVPATLLTGAGDLPVEFFDELGAYPLALVAPVSEGITAVDAYCEFDRIPLEPGELGGLREAVLATSPEAIAQKMSNNLAAAACRILPELEETRRWCAEQSGVLGAMITGSGSYCFALCASQQAAEDLVEAAHNKGYLAQTAHLAS